MKKLLFALGFFTVLGAIALTGLQLLVLTPEAVQEEALRQIRRGFTGQVKLGSARITALSTLAIRDLVLSDPEGQERFVALRSATLWLDPWSVLAGRLRFSELAIEGLELGLKKIPGGGFTFEKFIKKDQAWLPRVRGPFAHAAADAAAAVEPAAAGAAGAGSQSRVAIDRIVIKGSRINYLDGFLPLQIHQIAGSLTLEPDHLEIRELRGRAFDRFVLSVRGTLKLPGPGHELVIKLDEAPIKPLLSFIPPLNLMLTLSREQLEGSVGMSIETRADPHGEESHVSVRFRDLHWMSRMLASTVQAPQALVKFVARGSGDTARIEGDATLDTPLVRPNASTQDIPMQDLTVNFDHARAFARVRGYTGRFKTGTITGAGYASWQTPKPDYELSFGLERVPLAELGLAGPDSSALARDLAVTARGRFVPGMVALDRGQLALGASKLYGRGNMVPDAEGWLVRDASARLELDGSDLARLLGVAGTVKIAGRLDGTVYPQGPLSQLRGTGKLDKTQVTVTPLAGGDAVTVAVDECPMEVSSTQLVLPLLIGNVLGGRLTGMLAISNTSTAPAGARLNVEVSEIDAVALARALGVPGLFASGRVSIGGLVGSRTNVGSGAGGPPPPPPQPQGWSSSLLGPMARLAEGTGIGGMLAGPTAAPSPARGAASPSPPPPPVPAGPIFSGNVLLTDATVVHPAVRTALAAANLTELRIQRATALMNWEADGLVLTAIHGAGPAGEVTGKLLVEAPGRARGKLAIAVPGRAAAIEVPIGPPVQ